MDGDIRNEFDKIGVALKMINDNMATKADLAGVRAEMATKADLAGVVTEVRAAIREELRDVRGALRPPATTTE